MIANIQQRSLVPSKMLERSLRFSNWSLYPFCLLVVLWVGWLIIGCLAGIVNLLLMLGGKGFDFPALLDRFAFYGWVFPLGLMVAFCALLQLTSRVLWCALPVPALNRALACISVAGRVALIVAAVYIWKLRAPATEWLLLPMIIACAAIAWAGFFAEGAFLRRAGFACTPERSATPSAEKLLQTRDVGAWIGSRFPRARRIGSRVFAPLSFVALSMIYGKSLPDALLGCFVISAPIMQLLGRPEMTPGKLKPP